MIETLLQLLSHHGYLIFYLAFNRHVQKAEQLLQQYGDAAMCFAFFLPVIRYLLPIFAGLRGVLFLRFALISYTSAVAWTAIYFSIGALLGNHLVHFLAKINPLYVGATMLIGLRQFCHCQMVIRKSCTSTSEA